MLNQKLLFNTIQDHLVVMETELSSIIQTPAALITEMSEHLIKAGGKRLRPALYFLCAKSGSAEPPEMLAVATALELIHMATLVHDDVIDEAATRRGLPTANSKWGNQAAVLTGDYLFAKAFSLVAENGTPQMLKILTDIVCSMSEGEILQLKSVFDPDQSEADYQLRIGKKTAEFLAASCKLGGMSAGFSEPDVEALQQYGHSLGMAFQLTDDILDITQSSDTLGKPSGNDLRQGILTAPILYALQSSPYNAELKKMIMLKDMSPANLARGLEIVLSTDAIDYSYRQVQQYLEQARSMLRPSFAADLRDKLSLLADLIAERHS